MANLGVVPWFRFLAFLLLPILRFLLARLFLVTLVKETMSQLLRYISSLIPTPPGCVKRICPWATAFFIAFQLVAPSALAKRGDGNHRDYVISIGEHLEIPSRGLRRFSVTDQQVISYKWLEQRSRFLVEAKKVGYSELVVWDAHKRKTTHRFYILSKHSFLKLKRIQKTLEGMGLATSLQGHILVARGSISKSRDYFILHKILAQHAKGLYLDVELERPLRNHLVGKAYKILFGETASGVSCQHDGIHITCFHQKEDVLAKDIRDTLKRNYAIKLIARSRGKAKENYRIRLLIFQFERIDGRELSLGLGQLETTGEELFEHGVTAMVKKNQILLRENHIRVSTLAWPETMAMPYRESTVEMGAEIPYQVGGKQSKKIHWKFAGIRLKMTLHPHGQRVRIQYTTEVKRPGEEGQVKGSRNRSATTLRLGQAREIFQIGLQTTGGERMGIPLLHKIPLVGELFSSSSEQRNFKKIVGYLKVEKTP